MNQLILPVICFYANYLLLESKSKSFLDFPGGTEDKNPSAKAGDMGSIPGPGTFHRWRSNSAQAPQLEKALTKQGDLVLSVKYPKWLEPE